MVGDFFIGIVSLRRLFQQVVHRVDAPLAVQEFCCDDGPQRQRAAVEYLVPQRQHVVRRGIGDGVDTRSFVPMRPMISSASVMAVPLGASFFCVWCTSSMRTS